MRMLMIACMVFNNAAFFLLASSRPARTEEVGTERVVILVAAAASLQPVFARDLIPEFEKNHPGVKVDATFDASGKLQAQIENGLEADVFMAAAMGPVNALAKRDLIAPESVREVLENRIVLIRPAASASEAASFADASKADILALGDPDSVPAGQYAREVFVTLGIWDQAKAKASFGSSVTEVINWVAEGSADLGVVYATDAADNPNVEVVCEAPAGSLKQRVVFPVGVVKASRHPEEARRFAEFLASETAKKAFVKYGFAPIE